MHYFYIMSIRKIIVKNATIRIPTGNIGIIGRYKPGALKERDLPKPVIIQDEDDLLEYECELVEVVPIKQVIPSVLSRISENKDPLELELELLERLKIESISNNVAFYLYTHGKHLH